MEKLIDKPIMERPPVDISGVSKEMKENFERVTNFNYMCKDIIPYIEKIMDICDTYGQVNIDFRVYGDGKYMDFSGDDNLKLEKCGTAEYKIETKFKVV